eukprot:CFRG4535T1
MANPTSRRKSLFVPEVPGVRVKVTVPTLELTKFVNLDPLAAVWEVQKKILEKFGLTPTEGLYFGIFLETEDDSSQAVYLQPQSIFNSAIGFDSPTAVLNLRFKERIYKSTSEAKKHRNNKKKADLQKKLIDCVCKNNVSKVLDILEKGLDPNFHTETGDTPLARAVVNNQTDMMKALAKGGAYLDLHNVDGQSVLHKAAAVGAIPSMKMLLSLGMWVGLPNVEGQTATVTAIKSNQIGSIGILLDNNVPLEVVGNGNLTELHLACYKGQATSVRRLLKHGAVINALDLQGGTSLHICASRNQVECAKVLLEAGIDTGVINYAGQTAYKMALVLQSTSTANMITAFGGDAERSDGAALQATEHSADIVHKGSKLKQQTVKARAFATFSFMSEDEKLLSFNAGDIISILDKESSYLTYGYWYGCLGDGQTGLFPYKLVYELVHPTVSTRDIEQYILLQRTGLAVVHLPEMNSQGHSVSPVKKVRPSPPEPLYEEVGIEKDYSQLNTVSYLGPSPPKPPPRELESDEVIDDRRPSTFQTISFSREVGSRMSIRPLSMAAIEV